MDTSTSNQEVHLGIYDGDVPGDEVNGAIATAEKPILSVSRRACPTFPRTSRLPKLRSGHPLVLLFWEVLKKVPEHVRPDRALGYRQRVAEPDSMGEMARQEVHQVIGSAPAARRRRGSTFPIQKQSSPAPVRFWTGVRGG